MSCLDQTALFIENPCLFSLTLPARFRTDSFGRVSFYEYQV
jgi:hypothetical protein